jgi:hypothetical protein
LFGLHRVPSPQGDAPPWHKKLVGDAGANNCPVENHAALQTVL